MPRIYISRELVQAQDLVNALTVRGFEVDCKSQITREFLDFSVELKAFDWIFFSSPYAVASFFKIKSSDGCKLGALGSGTAKALQDYGKVDFIGEGSSTIEIGKQFLAQIGSEKVLFPSPEKGLRSVQSVFPKTQFEELICYRTILNSSVIESADAYVFSSPSNVHAFAEKKPIPSKCCLLCFWSKHCKST